MSSAAQILANQANALHSTGPITEEGKARVAENRTTHGLAGSFRLLPWESPEQFTEFAATTRAEYNPQTGEEERLVHSIIQHYWLMQRALTLQDAILCQDAMSDADQKKISLLIRYQTTNERSYYKAMKELKTIRKQQIGFESQNAKTRLTNAKAEALEIETEVHKTVEAPLPGNIRIPFADIQDACAAAIRALVDERKGDGEPCPQQTA
jgi:hypothetical protein